PLVCRNNSEPSWMVRGSRVDIMALRLGRVAIRVALCSDCCRRASSILPYTDDSVRRAETRSSEIWARIRTWTSARTAAVNGNTTASIDTRSVVRRCSKGRVNMRIGQLKGHRFWGTPHFGNVRKHESLALGTPVSDNRKMMLRRQGLRGALCPIHRGLSSVLAKLLYASCFALLLLGGVLLAEDSTVHGSVRVVHRSESESDSGEVVIWLTPPQSGGSAGPGPTSRLVQKNKKFVPHVLAVTRGTQIEFPNEDLFFHSVFSIHQGKTIDLGLYESGAARKIRFSQPGVSYIFCKIHPEMSAVVVVLQTRFFSMTDAAGNFQISHVP